MPGNKRKLRSIKNPLLFDDDDAAVDIVTHEDVPMVDKLGRTKIKRIKVPLKATPDAASLSHSQANDHFVPYLDEDPNLYENVDEFGPVPTAKNNKVSLFINYIMYVTFETLVQNQTDYLKEFVDQIDELLRASLCRDGWNIEGQRCGYCDDGNWAPWRCVDCTLGQPACRKCMRHLHKTNPLHRIERWTGTHYRPAELWEVGTCLIVPHREGNTCDVFKFQEEFLEHFEVSKDQIDQDQMGQTGLVPGEDSADLAGPMSWNRGGQHNDDDNNIDHMPFMPSYLPPRPTIDMPGAGSGPGSQHVPNRDALNNRYVRIVHTNGIHQLALVTCHCQGRESVALDLVACRFTPTSFSNIRTLFSAEVLDYSRLCNLELKSSSYQFYQLLFRLTSPEAPAEVANLYHEYRRMARVWRWIKRLQSAGYIHKNKSPQQVSTGELANFCPACPQPGINLPAGWKSDPNTFVYRRVFVADGNFKADHVRQKNNVDVWLSEGGGMVPKCDEYETFLQQAFEFATVSHFIDSKVHLLLSATAGFGQPPGCRNTFKAITNALLASKACDVKGVAGIACARHGCYAPGGLVDLYTGEQQKNIDFALLQALETTHVNPAQGMMLIYDIGCQYSIHLKKRIGHRLPPGLEIDCAIGLFHVHAHQESCFFRYATSLIPGAGIVAGEILESLWSSLNSISPTARTATLAHRAEILDDHVYDSNEKKCLNMANLLCRSFEEAQAMVSKTEQYFTSLSSTVQSDLQLCWEAQIQEAEAERKTDLSVMNIYAAVKGQQHGPGIVASSTSQIVSPARIWIRAALQAEELQIDIQDQVRRIGQQPYEDDINKVKELRDQLSLLLIHLHELQSKAGISDVGTGPAPPAEDETEFSDDELDAEDSTDSLSSDATPIERQLIPLPSHGRCPAELGQLELSLRLEQAEWHLSRLRDLIADKSFQYSHVMREAPTNAVVTKLRAAVKHLNQEITRHCRIYNHTYTRLLRLDTHGSTLHRFQHLTKDDVRASTAVLDPNTPGSTGIRLSWIWANTHFFAATHPTASTIHTDATPPEHLTECEHRFVSKHPLTYPA